MNITLRPDAEADLKQAYDWYEKQSEGLGENFLLCVEDVITSIIETPKRFPIVFKEVRRALVGKFPYAVFYVNQNGLISIIAVFHCSRKPGIWIERIKDL